MRTREMGFGACRHSSMIMYLLELCVNFCVVG